MWFSVVMPALRQHQPSGSSQDKVGHAHQVVRGGHQVSRKAGAVQVLVPPPPEPTHRFHAPEDLSHAFPRPMAQSIAGEASGSAADDAGSPLVLWWVRRLP